MTSKFRFYLLSLIATAIVFLVAACSPKYYVTATWEQFKILKNREKITKIIEDPSSSPELKNKLSLVQQAREYSIEIGLTPKDSFTYYTDIKRDILLWVLTASPAYKLEPYMWWFPFVGSVPYKGFFCKEDGLEEAKKLEQAGYDIFLRPSPAYSTLGWFNDPLLSTIVSFDEVSLVDTVLHEILHGTIWIKGDVSFNETLANFIGITGAIDFFEKKELVQLSKKAQNNLSRERIFSEIIQNLIFELEQFYNEEINTPSGSKEMLSQKKSEIINRSILEWEKAINKLSPEKKSNLVLNNASIIGYSIYTKQFSKFEKLYSLYGSNLKEFIKVVKKIKEESSNSDKSPYEILDEFISLKLQNS